MTKQSVSATDDSPTNDELVRRLQDGNGSAPELLLRQSSAYLTALAIRYGRNLCGSSMTEDLKQEGAIALLEAAKRFDSAFGNRFLTYATPAIQTAMLDYAAQNALPLSIPTGRYHQLRGVRRLMAEEENVPEAALTRIHRGEVVPGMSRAEVLFAYGPPPAIRTPNLRNESWIYWYGSDNQSVRVVFRGDKVRNIIKAE